MPDTERPDPSAPAPASDAAVQLRRALGAVQDMRARLEANEARAHEPIAIVGLACRFPGGEDPAAWWRTLALGDDAVSLVPPERWDREALYDPDPDVPGRMSTRWGGFIDAVDRFDAAFFGISPREAVSTDPQQRLLLEMAWHALEDAGQAPDALAGSRTGVYVGMSTNDYSRVLSAGAGAEWIDSHASMGNSVAVAAGRLAYTLGLQGPAMVIDTACSSSLVAVHQAVRALRGGEIELGIAAGVNLVLLPELTIGFSKARMMAADGRCKTFDAAADGYVRGEGCGVVVLKRLSDALAAGDDIHALVLGTAVNHDGRSNGLTAPNGPAQVAVIRAALADAKVAPALVSCLEAHGTGTALGDPIESRALGEVFGGERVGEAPWLASVKTQVGHLEAAAGIAGLIKLALCLRERTVAPHLHFTALNPHIAEDGFPFRIPRAATPWQPVQGRWIGGVSSFGFSGTNAHVVLEAAPAPVAALPAATRTAHVLPISARDPAALEALRQDVARALRAEPDLAAIAATLGAGRAHFAQRIAVVAQDPAQALAALEKATPANAGEAPMIAFLFTGQGCQYAGMARGLLAEPRFRATIERCEAALGGRLGAPLTRIVAGDDAVDLGRTDLLQPVLFALEYAVADLWRSWGVEPAAVLGHSLGEIAAACFAGAMDLEPALAFVAERGRLMQSCEGRGGMAAVLASAERTLEVVAGGGVTIAAYNAPASCVIAGDEAALASALARLEAAGVATQRLEVATAFHSAALDPCLAELERAASAMPMRPALLPVASNLLGTCVHAFDAAYWRRQAREPVRFAQGLGALHERGCRLFLEVGPHPVLSGFGRAAGIDATFLASLRRGGDDARVLAEALAQLYCHGATIDWKARVPAGQRRARLAGYPFQRERYWPNPLPHAVLESIPVTGGIPGRRIDSPAASHMYESHASTRTMPFLADHVVFGDVVAPGALHAVLALAALQAEGADAPAIEDVVFEQALVVPEAGVRLQLVLEPDGAFELCSRSGDGEWIRHARGRALAQADAEAPPANVDLAAPQATMARDDAGPEALFDMLAGRGIVLGPSFRGTRTLWRGAGEALAEVVLPDSLREEARSLPVHPAVLDACFQALGATFTGPGAEGGYLPLSIDRISLWHDVPERIYCHARSAGGGGQVAVGDFTVCDEGGRVVMRIDGLQVKRVEAPAARDPLEGAYLALDWAASPLGEACWADPAALAAAARAVAPLALDNQAEALAAGLEQLAQAYAADALSTLGVAAPMPLDRAMKHAGVPPARARLLGRVRQLAAGHPVQAPIAGDTLAHRLREAHPRSKAEIDLVARCGSGLPAVLQGVADPLQLIFPQEGDGESGVYGGAGLAQQANAMVAAAVAAALARRAGRALRILEAGGGTGATTQAVLPLLAQAPGSRYVFTDVSPAFLKAAQSRFGTAVEIALFDVEKAPAVQGLANASFDLVIAANVVHATERVAASLAHLRALLAPGGCLLLVESTQPQQWWDIVFGLTDGWWRFKDTELRPEHPLLGAQAWRQALAAAGYAAAESVPVDGEERQSVLVASAPWRPVLAVHDDRDGQARELAIALAAECGRRGIECEVLGPRAAVERIERPAAAGENAVAVVYTGGLGNAGTTCAVDRDGLHQAFDLVRAMALAGRDRLTLVTSGARGPGPVDAPGEAGLWGLGEVAALEHPELRLRRVDLDPGDAIEPSARLLVDEVQADDGENAAGWRNGTRVASRLVEAMLPATGPVAFSPDATCLVVGAFGGLGPLLARWLAANGAGTLVLAGRNEPPDALARELRELPATVHLRCVDATDAKAMTALLDEIRRDMAPLASVFHLAGSVADGALLTQDWERFASVLGAKADGAFLLDRLTRGDPLRDFVLFSTSASLIGNPGQANHAAANACLDALAHHRRSAGLPALSLNWGAWSGAGAVVAGDYAERMAARGVKTFPPEAGWHALGRAMAGDRAQVGVVAVDWTRFLAGYGERVPPFFAALAARAKAGGAASRRPAARRPSANLRRLVAEAPGESRLARLEAFLREEAAAVLGMKDATRIDPEFALNELGLDSLLALELRTRIGDALGTKQPATLLFNYPSVAALTRYLAQELVPADAAVSPSASDDSALASEIAGMSDAEIEALIDDELGALQKR